MSSSVVNEFKVPSDSVYRGEGNCNVVLSLKSSQKILRIRKAKKTVSILTWIISFITDWLKWYYGSLCDEEQRDLSFYKRIIRPLIGFNFVCDAQQVVLSKKQVKILEEKIYTERPEFRRNKGLQCGRAALFDDYAYLPNDSYCPFDLSSDTYSIEIKPKQGWIPFNEKNYPKCTFCMKQFYKCKKGYTKSISKYCPLDLFSGDSARVTRALKALIDTPQNNLKIFKNGKFCYGEGHDFSIIHGFIEDFFANTTATYDHLINEFCELIKSCLLTNFETIERENNCKEKLFCEWNKIIQETFLQNIKLPKGCVLERILSMQMLDAEGNQFYSKMLGSKGNKAVSDYGYVRRLLHETALNEGTCLKCQIMMLASKSNSQKPKNSVLKLVPYLISAIAKDCSIMLTFKRVLDESHDNLGMKNYLSTKYGDFIVNVGVFDLYPKPVSTIVKNHRKMKDILEVCEKL